MSAYHSNASAPSYKNDGGTSLFLLAAYGAPRRHSRACSGIQRNKAKGLGHVHNKMIRPLVVITSFALAFILGVTPAQALAQSHGELRRLNVDVGYGSEAGSEDGSEAGSDAAFDQKSDYGSDYETYDATAAAWVTPEAFWISYAESKGGLTWGRGGTYPPYKDVQEFDTFMVEGETGICLMEFFHSRWRRANDVRRWDPDFNKVYGCHRVFD